MSVEEWIPALRWLLRSEEGMWEESRGNTQCKSPEAGALLGYPVNSKEQFEEADWVKKGWGGHESEGKGG